jgi:hypothetical protein
MGVLAKRNITVTVTTEPLSVKIIVVLIKHNTIKCCGSYGGIAHAFQHRFILEKKSLVPISRFVGQQIPSRYSSASRRVNVLPPFPERKP